MDLRTIGFAVDAQRKVRSACDSLLDIAQDPFLPSNVQREARELFERLWDVQEKDIPELADKVNDAELTI